MNNVSFTSALLVGLGEASQRVIDPGISSIVGVSSPSILADGSSIASLNDRENCFKKMYRNIPVKHTKSEYVKIILLESNIVEVFH